MKNTIQKKITESIKAKDSTCANVYRGVLSVIQEREGRENKEFNDDEILGIIEKEKNGYLETAEGFKTRRDWFNYDQEYYKSRILGELLPQKIPVEDYPELVDAGIELTGAESMKDMGKVVKYMKSTFGIQLDYKVVSGMIKERLQ